MRFDIRAPVVPSVVGLLAQGGIRANQLTWESFGYTVAVYGSTTNNRGNATRLGITSDNVFTHMLNGSVDYYYWVRGVDAQGRETGVWNPTNSVAGLQVTSQLMVELDIAANAVSAAKLNVAAISSATGNLNPGTVNSANIVAGAISSREISAGYIYAGTVAASNISSGTLSSQVVYAGTISANNISGGTISGITFSGGGIYIGSGSTPSGKQFEVSTGGLMWADNIVCRTGIFEANSGSPAIMAYQGSSGTVSSIFSTVYSGNYSGNAHAVVGKHARAGTSGICGVANGYDFYADGSGINYGPFTGAHDTLIEKGEVPNIGDILVDTGIAVKKNLSNTISYSTTSTMPLQKGSCGVMVKVPEAFGTIMLPNALREDDFVSIGPDGKEVTTQTYCREYDQIRRTHNLAAMNAVGEGQVNVCGESGNLEIGDLIVTSSTPGKGMKQADDLVRSYTVAKCRENVTFDSPEQVKMVACIYLCG
jgi:hypothetical protein